MKYYVQFEDKQKVEICNTDSDVVDFDIFENNIESEIYPDFQWDLNDEIVKYLPASGSYNVQDLEDMIIDTVHEVIPSFISKINFKLFIEDNNLKSIYISNDDIIKIFISYFDNIFTYEQGFNFTNECIVKLINKFMNKGKWLFDKNSEYPLWFGIPGDDPSDGWPVISFDEYSPTFHFDSDIDWDYIISEDTYLYWAHEAGICANMNIYKKIIDQCPINLANCISEEKTKEEIKKFLKSQPIDSNNY